MLPRAPYDCTRCGACCCNLEQNRQLGFIEYVPLDPDDALLRKPKLVRRFVVYNERDEPHMRLDREQRCAALRGEVGRSVECSIYPDRPGVCRRLQPGSAGCLKSRAERGLPPHEPE
jgi:Fe-S-cluster containining protein